MRVMNPYIVPGLPKFSKKTPDQIWLDVMKVVAKRYELTIAMMMGTRQTYNISYGRQVYCYWMRWYFGDEVTYTQLAEYLRFTMKAASGTNKERFDHTAAIYCEKTYKDRLDTDSPLPSSLRHICSNTAEDFKQIDYLIRLQCL
jgi:hypothetical protein